MDAAWSFNQAACSQIWSFRVYIVRVYGWTNKVMVHGRLGFSMNVAAVLLEFLDSNRERERESKGSRTSKNQVYWTNHAWQCCHFWPFLGCWEFDTLREVLLALCFS